MIRAVALSAALCAAAPEAAAEPALGFVNLAGDAAAGSSAIDQIRPWVARRGVEVLGAGAIRTALEAPLAPPQVDVTAVAAARERAFNAYSRFDHAVAMAEIERALELAAALEPGPAVDRAVVDLAVLAGTVEHGRQARAAAIRWFRLAHTLGGKAELDPGLHSPQVTALYKTAVAATPRSGSVEIAGGASSATVDGRPLRSGGDELFAGFHWLVLRRPGHRPLAQLIEIKPGQVTSIDRALPALEGSARIESLRRSIGAEPELTILAAIASTAGVAELLVIRGPADKLEAARFRDGGLSRWVAANNQGLSTLFPADLRVKRDPDERQRPDLGLSPPGPVDREPWYARRWVIGVGVGLAVAAIATSAVVIYSNRDTELGLTFCGVGTLCPER